MQWRAIVLDWGDNTIFRAVDVAHVVHTEARLIVPFLPGKIAEGTPLRALIQQRYPAAIFEGNHIEFTTETGDEFWEKLEQFRLHPAMAINGR